MQRAFQFPEPVEGAATEPRVLMINDESFELAPDPTGPELLGLAARALNAAGTHQLISRAIQDDDWDRWVKVTAHCKLQDFGKIATAIIDLYSDFPTTAAAG